MSSAKSRAPSRWVVPFALALPNLPPQSTAPSRAPRRPSVPPPVRRSVLRGLGGDGTAGLRAGGPGPPTPSLGPVAAPGRADVGAPREARALRPRNRPRPRRGGGDLPEPPRSREGRARLGGALQAGPAGRAEPEPEPEPSPSPSRGGRRWVQRAGRGGRGGGRSPVLTSAGAVHPGAGALRAGGLMAGRGAGAPASHPPSRRRLQSD